MKFRELFVCLPIQKIFNFGEFTMGFRWNTRFLNLVKIGWKSSEENKIFFTVFVYF